MNLDEAVDGGVAIGLVLPRGGLLVLRGRSTVAVAAVMLPVGNPIDEHLPDLNVGDGHFLHSIHLERRSMQHLLDGARSGLEDSQSNHLVESELQMLWLHVRSVVAVSVVDLASVLLLLVRSWLAADVLDVVAVVVGECTAQVHHLFLTCVL